jgi:hypothetical protein
MHQCKICETWIYCDNLKHVCPPKWKVWDEEIDYELDIYAIDEEEAVTKFAEEWDQDDHSLLQGDHVVVTVKSSEGVETKWKATGEAEPTYYATKIFATETKEDK